MKQRKRTKQLKHRMLAKGVKWWLPFAELMHTANDMDYEVRHGWRGNKYRWWIIRIDYKENESFIPHCAREVFSSGSRTTMLAALNLMVL